MNTEKIEIIEKLINYYTGPILIDDSDIGDYNNAVNLNADSEDEQIMCTYNKENGERIYPNWYKKLNELNGNKKCLLLIRKINEVPANKQIRFNEILKYNSINGEKLPDNCVIILTHTDLNEKPIADSLMCLLAKVD